MLPVIVVNGRALSTGALYEKTASRMASDMLATANGSGNIKPARFSIGNLSLRESDYKQILRWSEMLSMEPEKFFLYIQNEDRGDVCFEENDGAIISLSWNLDVFPMVPDVHEPGVSIKNFEIFGTWPNAAMSFCPALPPSVTKLVVSELCLEKLDLSLLPNLIELDCSGNYLKTIDLSVSPGIRVLNCRGNRMSNIDVTCLCGLIKLDCANNQILNLDLTGLGRLEALSCNSNRLHKLDLQDVKNLNYLNCGSNSLHELDVHYLLKLEHLECWVNHIKKLTLNPNHRPSLIYSRGNFLPESLI